MPSDRSDSRRSTERHRSIILGTLPRRSRSRIRARDSRQGHRSSEAPRNDRRDSERRRSRRSPAGVKLQARSRNRSVGTPPLRGRSSRASPMDTRYLDFNRSSRHRLRTPRRENVDRSRSPIHNIVDERSKAVTMHPLHIDNVNNELLRCIKESLQSISAVNSQSKEKFANNNVVPEFDPKLKNQTIITWLNKVKECSEIYGWDSKQTAHYALPKLVGTAKKWYEGQPSVLLTWDEWVEKLKSAFPSNENYGYLLTEMLAKRAKFGDDLEEYYYEKLIALNRCGIVGRNAIDCIVYGIDDRSVRYGAEAAGFEDTDKLLGYLRGVKHERLDTNKFYKKTVRPTTETSRISAKNDPGRVVKCFNCHEIGHVVSACKKPITKCQKCKRIGHDDSQCSRSVWVDKSEIKTL